jgi:hypothetical protein
MSHLLWYTKRMKMKNEELDKAFDNFKKSINNSINAIEDFVQMDINKTAEPTLETQRDEVATSEPTLETQRDEEEQARRWRGLYGSWKRRVNMNGYVYIREDEDEDLAWLE